MEDNEFNQKCFYHDENFNFYCFDDKKFLCDNCFKNHRKHNIDLKSQLIKNSLIYEKINQNKSMSDSLEEMKASIIKIKQTIDEELNKKRKKINELLSSLKNSSSSSPVNSIFNLKFKEYQIIEEYSSLYESVNNIKIKIDELFKNNSNKNEFRKINKEVNIIEHSQEKENYPLGIMIEKKSGDYSLFDGQNKKHFAIFDLNKKLYLKNILISVKQKLGCALKTFKVSIKNEEGNWEEINSFCCQNNKSQIDMQAFSIEKETQFVKIDFIDAWSKDGGDLILIRRLSFLVSDI